MSLLLNYVTTVINTTVKVASSTFTVSGSMGPGPLHGFWQHQGPQMSTCFWYQHRTSAWHRTTDHKYNTASAKTWAPDTIIALGGSTGHQHGLQDNTGHRQWTLTWSPTWTPAAAQPMDTNMALGSSIDHRWTTSINMTLCASTAHGN